MVSHRHEYGGDIRLKCESWRPSRTRIKMIKGQVVGWSWRMQDWCRYIRSHNTIYVHGTTRSNYDTIKIQHENSNGIRQTGLHHGRKNHGWSSEELGMYRYIRLYDTIKVRYNTIRYDLRPQAIWREALIWYRGMLGQLNDGHVNICQEGYRKQVTNCYVVGTRWDIKANSD